MIGFIFVVAATFALCALTYGGILRKRVPPEERRWLLLLCALIIPMPTVMLYGVRLPLLDRAVRALVDPTSPVYPWLQLCYAPLTEELGKIWPLLLVPAWARRTTAENAPRVALALGLGFGLGEVLMIGAWVARSPLVDTTPWYLFGGFVGERFLVCLCHAFFVFMSVGAWKRWLWPGRLATGLLLAMALHFSLNAPILFARWGWLGPSPVVQSVALQLWVLVFFIAGAVVFARALLGREGSAGQLIFGEIACPDCGVTYPRPLFGINLGPKRYERCPACKKWHLL